MAPGVTAAPIPGAQAAPAVGAQPATTAAPATAAAPGTAAAPAAGANNTAFMAQLAQAVVSNPALAAEWKTVSASGDQAKIQAFVQKILAGAQQSITPGATGQAQTGVANLSAEPVTVNTQHLAGAITGIADIVTKRQKLLAQVSIAIAQDAATNGTPNQAAIVRLNMETTNANLLNDQAKKLYDALEQSIRTWTRP